MGAGRGRPRRQGRRGEAAGLEEEAAKRQSSAAGERGGGAAALPGERGEAAVRAEEAAKQGDRRLTMGGEAAYPDVVPDRIRHSS